ncbi:hypothetical protein Xbud_03499 [Xenorhabdus budapestensis]|uniref:Transcriptional regulator n=1 Tax=Xenorhabdus budapestensis TaxID=290110 RepID=A0A2D0IPE4_XENBU|nr:hypothetical protein Xbud_03499 [Xenorhabdus budapestensis]
MIQDSGQEKALRQIEIETAAFNRIIHSILKVLNKEQREYVYRDLETFSLSLVKEMKESDSSRYNREQAIRNHVHQLLGNSIPTGE